MAFGRKDANCPRCIELLNGSAPRSGWQASYYGNAKQRAQYEASQLAAIKAHFAPGGPHDLGKCGPVCTAFDA